MSTTTETDTAKTFDTSTYWRSHGRQPRGTRVWIFKNLDSGESKLVEGYYSDAKRQVPDGRWIVYP